MNPLSFLILLCEQLADPMKSCLGRLLVSQQDRLVTNPPSRDSTSGVCMEVLVSDPAIRHAARSS
jgi:hypothetical protein